MHDDTHTVILKYEIYNCLVCVINHNSAQL